MGGVWVETQRLSASDAIAGDNFGQSVSISGNKIIVGLLGNNGVTMAMGAAYLFEKAGGIWVEQQKLLASDAVYGDRFGSSVSISDDKAIIGAYGNDDGGSQSGSAYIFELISGDWEEAEKDIGI